MADNLQILDGANVSRTVKTTDNAGVHTPHHNIDTLPALVAGTATIGKLGANSGVDIGDVDVTSVTPGTAAASLGKAEDAPAASGDVGVMALAVRNDAGGALAGTDGDYIPLSTDSAGRLRVDASISGGGGTQYTEDTASAGAESLMLAGAVRRDTAASSSGTDGDYSTLNTDASGRLWTNGSGVTQPGSVADGADATFGAQADAASAGDTTTTTFMALFKRLLQRITTLLAVFPTTIDTNSGNKSASTLRVAIATDQPALTNALLTTPGGNVAHDAADSGNPVKVGGRARSSEIAAVANDDRTDLLTDLVGKLITLPYANPENFVSGCISSAMTGTTSTSLVGAPGAGLRNYITTIIVSNGHATVGTDILIQDGSGGTTLLVIPAAAVYGGAAITLPVPLRQPTANTALYAQNVTTGASTKVSAVGYKGA